MSSVFSWHFLVMLFPTLWHDGQAVLPRGKAASSWPSRTP